MFEDKDREKKGRGIGCRGRYCHFWASDEGGGLTRPEEEIVRPRGSIAEVSQFAEGERIKAWEQWSEWGWMGFYREEGISSSPPPTLTSSGLIF